jgi:hypothetical protein
VGELGDELRKQVLGALEEAIVQNAPLIVGIEGQIPDLGFHQVLEEVGSEGEVRNVAPLAVGDLHEKGRVVDVGVGDAHSQIDIPPAPPAAGPHEDELPPGQELVEPAHRPPNVLHLLQALQVGVPSGST